MEASALVIEVRYGDFLRSFDAKVVDAELDLSMRGLIEKIFSLFNFAPDMHDMSMMLTYVNEDGDSVALVDDDDLRNVAKQSLNPLRITIKLKDAPKKTSAPSSLPAEDFITWDISRAKLLFQCPNHEVSELLETAPEHLREKLVKLSTESKDRDWSEVDTVVKVLSSDQKKTIDCSDMVPPASSTCTETRRRRWIFYVLEGRKKELLQSFENLRL